MKGGMGVRRLTGDTMAALQAHQLEMERMFKRTSREKAKEYVEWIAEKQEWTDGDMEEVLGALGLIGK